MRLPAPCCDLGLGDGPPHFAAPWLPFADVFGFRYRLCPEHYRRLVGVLARHEEVCPAAAFTPAGPEPPKRPTGHPRPGQARASGEEQRRARERAGWSLRQLAGALDRSRSQLQAAETGRRPVDPVVAVWVRSVLGAGAAA